MNVTEYHAAALQLIEDYADAKGNDALALAVEAERMGENAPNARTRTERARVAEALRALRSVVTDSAAAMAKANGVPLEAGSRYAPEESDVSLPNLDASPIGDEVARLVLSWCHPTKGRRMDLPGDDRTSDPEARLADGLSLVAVVSEQGRGWIILRSFEGSLVKIGPDRAAGRNAEGLIAFNTNATGDDRVIGWHPWAELTDAARTRLSNEGIRPWRKYEYVGRIPVNSPQEAAAYLEERRAEHRRMVAAGFDGPATDNESPFTTQADRPDPSAGAALAGF